MSTQIIETTHLFPILDQKLVELLRSLGREDWNRRTLARAWCVKDVAAHLLDGNMRMLSFTRDGMAPPPPDHTIESYSDLVGFLNQLNRDWVNAYKRVSPELLTDLLELTGKQYSAQIAKLDPMADAMFSVAWAGESVSPNWFHIAREYTEKWHHQQQIREAVGQQGIITREMFYPVADTFLRGLPHTYRDIIAKEGTTIRITIDGDAGGDWWLVRSPEKWQIAAKPNTYESAGITISQDAAWKLFTKGLSPAEAEKQAGIVGDKWLAKIVLQLVAVMA